MRALVLGASILVVTTGGLANVDGRATAAGAGVVKLRVPRSPTVRVVGATFVMGSTPAEMEEAVVLCEREPLGRERCRPSEHEIGPFIRAEGHAHHVTVSTFDLDRTEVTVGAYARCVVASACQRAGFPVGDRRYDRDDLPVTHVRWEDGRDFCRARGGRLPTEAEWELAARGGENRVFPWGKLYNPRLANHGSSVAASPGIFGEDPTDGSDGFVGLAPVGSFPDGATAGGLLDMAGNVAEWVADWYERDAEGFGYPGKAERDPRGPASGLAHVTRGGSFRDGGHWLRTAARRPALYPTRDIGFRCAYDVTQRSNDE